MAERVKKSFWSNWFNPFSRSAEILNPNPVKASADSVAYKDPSVDINDVKVENLIIEMLKTDPIIMAGMRKVVNDVVNDYEIVALKEGDEVDDSRAEMLRELLESKEIDIISLASNIVSNLVLYSRCYQGVEIGNGDGMSGLNSVSSYVLNTNEITPKYKSDGSIDYYLQTIKGQKHKIPPENVIYYVMNKIGLTDKGVSILNSAYKSVVLRDAITNYFSNVFKKSKGRGSWSINPVNNDEVVSKASVDKITKIIKMKSSDDASDFIFDNAVIEFKPFINDSSSLAEYQKMLMEYRSEVVIAMGVPPVFLGLPQSSSNATASYEVTGYDRYISQLQNMVSKVFNREFIGKLDGFDGIGIRFRKAHKRDELIELDVADKMKPFATLNEIREFLGLPLLNPLDFPEADNIVGMNSPIGVSTNDGNDTLRSDEADAGES